MVLATAAEGIRHVEHHRVAYDIRAILDALAHPAIVAREYGLPSVVGTRTATVRLEDGQRVEDGGAGVVQML